MNKQPLRNQIGLSLSRFSMKNNNTIKELKYEVKIQRESQRNWQKQQTKREKRRAKKAKNY